MDEGEIEVDSIEPIGFPTSLQNSPANPASSTSSK